MYVFIILMVPLAVAVLLREAWLHLVLPALGMAAQGQGKPETARQFFLLSVSAPSLFDEGARVDARYRLAWLHLQLGSPDEGIAQCRTVLLRKLNPAVEANTRLRLADCMDAAGDPQGAADERERASRALAGVVNDSANLEARARLLTDQRRFAEACAVYEEALARTPGWDVDRQCDLLGRMSLAAFQAGQPVRSADWAERALERKPSQSQRLENHSRAAIAYSTLKQLEKAVEHRQRAIELADEFGNRDRAAQLRVGLAGVLMKQGRLVEAIREGEEAVRQSLASRRLARIVEAESLRLLGRLDEARTSLLQARATEPYPQVALERHSQGIVALGQSWVELEDGEAAAAARFLEEADEGLSADPKLSLWLLATRAWARALLSDRAGAESDLEVVEGRTPEFASDPSTIALCRVALGRAAFALGDYPRARAAWEAYLGDDPEPAFRPQGHYFLGECLEQQGELESARAAYQQATELYVDTIHVRWARKRLAALGTASPRAESACAK